MSAVALADLAISPNNPLELAEQLFHERDWLCDRTDEEEIVAEIEGEWCDFRIWLAWQPELQALMFTCAYATRIHERARGKIHELLAAVNERMWLGHFDIGSQDGVILFRHAILMRGAQQVTSEQFEDLIDIAISECNRFYPAFQSVLWGGTSVQEAIEVALLDTVGEA